jgi:thiol:disulfide interchange protein
MAQSNQRSLPLWLLAVAAVLLLTRLVLYSTKAEAASAVQWLSVEEGMAQALETKKPVLLDFTAEWCGPCHMLDREVFQDKRLAATINADFVPIRVTDRRREDGQNPRPVQALQQRYAVTAFPTVVFADANGAERARMEGFRGEKEFERLMEQAR